MDNTKTRCAYWGLRERISIIGLLLVVSGCLSAEGPGGEGGDVEVIPMALKPDWIGFELGLEPPSLVKVGEIEFSPPGLPPAPPPPHAVDPDETFVPDPDEGITVFDSEGNLYELDFPKEDRAKLSAALRAQGRGGEGLAPIADFEDAPGLDFEVEKGLPNGVDNRFIWAPGSNGTGGTSYPYSTQGVFATSNGRCSATLFDHRVIVMAAHCWFRYNATGPGPGTWGAGQQFAAGYKGGLSFPYGIQGPDPAFVGSVYTAFLTNNCHITYNNSICPPLDISWMALSSTPTDSGGSDAGAMGYKSALPSAATHVFDGFPTCGNPESPAGCNNSLYRENGCSRTAITVDKYDSNCGGSYGQSGGPFWHAHAVGDYRLTGVLAGQKCDGNMGSSCAGIGQPIILHRITISDISIMDSLRSMF